MQSNENSVKFNIQKISINDNTNIVISILQESIKKYNITELSLISIIPENEDGLKGKILSIAEYVSGNLHGYKLMSFPADEVEIDPALKSIYDDYRAYLNETYQKCGKKAGDTEKGKTDSRYVIVRELLLRIIVSALTQKSDLEHGNNMMNFLRDFISKLLESQVLLDTKFSTQNIHKGSILNEELSPFDIAFSSRKHNDWMQVFVTAIEAYNNINLPKKAINKASSYLKNLRHIIAVHIILIANFEIKEEIDIGDFIQNTFWRFEETYFKKNYQSDKSVTKSKSHIRIKKEISDIIENEIKRNNWQSSNLTSSQKIIINQFNHKKEIFEKITCLYDLFVKTNLLIKFTESLSDMVSGVNWMLILSGCLNIANLNIVIRIHTKNCEINAFIPEEVKQFNKGKLIYKALTKYNLPGESFSEIAICSMLSLLDQPEIKKKFLSKMENTIQKLEELDKQIILNFKHSTIDSSLCRDIFSKYPCAVPENTLIGTDFYLPEIKSTPIKIENKPRTKYKLKNSVKNIKDNAKNTFIPRKLNLKISSNYGETISNIYDSGLSGSISYSEKSDEQSMSCSSACERQNNFLDTFENPKICSSQDKKFSSSSPSLKKLPEVPTKKQLAGQSNEAFAYEDQIKIAKIPSCEDKIEKSLETPQSLKYNNLYQNTTICSQNNKVNNSPSLFQDHKIEIEISENKMQIEKNNKYKITLLNELKDELYQKDWDNRGCCIRFFSSEPFAPPGILKLKSLLPNADISQSTFIKTFDLIFDTLNEIITKNDPDDKDIPLYQEYFNKWERLVNSIVAATCKN